MTSTCLIGADFPKTEGTVLDGADQSIATQIRIIEKTNRGVGTIQSGSQRINTKLLLQVSGTLKKKRMQYIHFKNGSTFHPHNDSIASRGFPSPNPGPRPRPGWSFASTTALASRSRCTTNSSPFEAAECSGILPREPRPRGPSPAGRTQQNRREKNFEKILAPQK